MGTKGDLNLYAYVYNDPLNRVDPSGTVVQCADEKDCDALTKAINALTSAKYKFNKNGELVRVSAPRVRTAGSTYYSKRLDQAIASSKTINLVIAQKFTASDGTTHEISEGHGGATVGHPGETQKVTISGSADRSTFDIRGRLMRDTPAEILMHELVGHAIPHIVGSDTGNAVENENKVRQEIDPSSLRQEEPWHDE